MTTCAEPFVWAPEPLFCPPGKRLVAQRELQSIVGGFQAGLLERLFDLGLLTLQQLERIGSLGGHVRRHLPVAVDVETHVDAPELRRVEPNVKLIGTGLRPGGDRDRETGNGDGGRGRGAAG